MLGYELLSLCYATKSCADCKHVSECEELEKLLNEKVKEQKNRLNINTLIDTMILHRYGENVSRETPVRLDRFLYECEDVITCVVLLDTHRRFLASCEANTLDKISTFYDNKVDESALVNTTLIINIKL